MICMSDCCSNSLPLSFSTLASTAETMLTYVKIFEEEKAGKDMKVLAGKKGSTERTKMLSKPRYLCMTGNLVA